MSTTVGSPDAIVRPQPPFGFRVEPPVVSKHKGETFTILNATAVTVHVSFVGLGTTPPEGDVSPLTRESFVINQENTNGVYDYHVAIAAVTPVLIGFTLRASAGSDPQIIID